MSILVSITDDHPLAIVGITNMLKSGSDIQITAIHNGKLFIKPQLEMRNNMLQFQKAQTSPKHITKLSSREKEILQLIAEEYSNREIADKLFLSLRTVQNHFFNLQQKLQAKNAVGMVKIAIQMGLIRP